MTCSSNQTGIRQLGPRFLEIETCAISQAWSVYHTVDGCEIRFSRHEMKPCLKPILRWWCGAKSMSRHLRNHDKKPLFVGSQCTGEMYQKPGFFKWCEMDFIHSPQMSLLSESLVGSSCGFYWFSWVCPKFLPAPWI